MIKAKIKYLPNTMMCFIHQKDIWITIISKESKITKIRFDNIGENNKIDLSRKTKIEKELIYQLLN